MGLRVQCDRTLSVSAPVIKVSNADLMLTRFLKRPVAMEIFTWGLLSAGSSYGEMCVPFNYYTVDV